MDSSEVKKLRREYAMSQERFARLLGVSLQTVRRWEAGLSKPLPIMNLKLEQLRDELAAEPPLEAGDDQPGAPHYRPTGTDLGGLLKGIGGLLKLVSRLAEGEEVGREGKAALGDGNVKAVYGFSVRMGLEGRPVIEQFGNVQETESGTVVAETREPLVDVLDEGDHILVVAELPGVEETDVRAQVQEDILEISAERGDRRYAGKVPLPAAVDVSEVTLAYRNGILEIVLPKQGGMSGHGTSVGKE